MDDNPYKAPQERPTNARRNGFGLHSIAYFAGVLMLCVAGYAVLLAMYSLYSIVFRNGAREAALSNEVTAAIAFAMFSIIPFTIARRLRRNDRD